MNNKTILTFLLVGLCCAGTSTFAQKNKKKPKEGTFTAVSATEAERIFTEGEKNFILEDYTKALFYFEQALEYAPDNATIHYKIAEIYLKGNTENDLQRAGQSIESALKLEKKNKYFYLLASQIYAHRHEYKKACEALKTMMKEIGGTEEHLYELAALYQEDDQPDEAIKSYNQAEATFGITELSSLQKQRVYLMKGKLDEAVAEGDKLIHAFPEDERFVLAQAEMLAQHGQAARGITYLEKFIVAHPDAGNAKMLRAGLYHDAGQEQKSRESVMKLMDDPEMTITSKVLMLGSYNAALSQNKSKKIKDAGLESFAQDLYKKLEANYPSDPDVHLVGGDLYLMLEKNEEACAQYRMAIRSGTSSFEAWQNLLFLETHLGQADSVIVHAEQALEFFPNQAMIYYFSGIAYSRKKNYHEAERTLEQAKRLSSGNSNFLGEINSMLGDAYFASKDYDKSDKAYDDALIVNPNNEYVLNNYSYYLALRKTNLEKAEKMSALVVKNHPDNISYIDTYAWVLYQEGKYKEAKKIMERAFIGEKASATNYEHYGDILYQLGEIEDAVIQWQKAKSLHGDNEVLNKKITDRKIH
ncbi:MAG: tetratricopeptide repeat protein [Bacteroidetes bacterium]|nr:tetratricopeptide repeat protein [Bacteroidota bacterium]